MKHNTIRRAAALLMILLALTAAWPAAARAEGGSLFVTGYTVTDTFGFPLGSIAKGTSVNITVSLRDIGGGAESGQLDAVKLDDSFTGGSLSVVKTSAEGMPLTYDIRLTNLQYKGVGQSLKLQVGQAGSPESYQGVELTITEAVVFEAPQPQQPPAPEPAPPLWCWYPAVICLFLWQRDRRLRWWLPSAIWVMCLLPQWWQLLRLLTA